MVTSRVVVAVAAGAAGRPELGGGVSGRSVRRLGRMAGAAAAGEEHPFLNSRTGRSRSTRTAAFVAGIDRVGRRRRPHYCHHQTRYSYSDTIRQTRRPMTQSRTSPRKSLRFLASISESKAKGDDGDGAESSLSSSSSSSSFFSDSVSDFASLGIRSPVLLHRIDRRLGLTRPTSVQAAAFGAVAGSGGDVTVGAETGSGKTLAYLLPLIDDILMRKASTGGDDGHRIGYDYARALILVPNKELVQQVVRMAMGLCGGSRSLVYGAPTLVSSDGSPAAALLRPYGSADDEDEDDDDDEQQQQANSQSTVRLAILPGGLKEPADFPPFRACLTGSDEPIDLIISTPAAAGPLGLKPKNIDFFADVQTLVVDEADMLLDGGYIRSLEDVLMGFRRADRLVAADDSPFGASKTQHVFVAATLPDSGLRSVDAYLRRRFGGAETVSVAGMHAARHSGLREPTAWIEEESKKGRMEKLVWLLMLDGTERDDADGATGATGAGGDDDVAAAAAASSSRGLRGEKVMVFLNSVDDVEGACRALQRAGVDALPYHAKIPLAERAATLDRFRRFRRREDVGDENENENDDDDDTVPVLVCTDLASRGLDVPAVDAVVQLQFAGNVVAHLHRMGRCGRADAADGVGRKTGRGIVFYGEKERDLVHVVQRAEREQERMALQGNDVLDVLSKDEDGDEEDAVKGATTPRTEREATTTGSVRDAFSRKRGFTKKRKKLRREAAYPPSSSSSSSSGDGAPV